MEAICQDGCDILKSSSFDAIWTPEHYDNVSDSFVPDKYYRINEDTVRNLPSHISYADLMNIDPEIPLTIDSCNAMFVFDRRENEYRILNLIVGGNRTLGHLCIRRDMIFTALTHRIKIEKLPGNEVHLLDGRVDRMFGPKMIVPGQNTAFFGADLTVAYTFVNIKGKRDGKLVAVKIAAPLIFKETDLDEMIP
jgi:hypothetical protein